ncbi:efflux RND transporter permease subunit [Rubripirellula reticaptiva]|uniref:Multidrug resistance protein MdtB n=1 Tax=Rubripirellula reticaptiva TaxID=2528013 RepID=A0A5C6EJC9_9BACT|nr:efflux RND transporter permease subunit [Rubripirellula reticaptiva]TWU48197.1 Multidrug resistance protein MdtB [Rubripirellula reticaptiva]
MNGFNLSDWALKHRSLVWYLMLVSAIMGTFSYFNLGREEDPSFTIKTMIVSAAWPGATLEETINQVTDRIEKKVEEIPQFDYAKSLNRPGQTTIFVNLKDSTPAEQVPQAWLRIRNLISDIQGEFPSGVVGPFFNDDFGDVYGNVFAFTSDGLTQRQLRDYVESARAAVMTVPNVGKVELIGAQDEVIYLEFSTRELASLGLTEQTVVDAIRSQNAITPSGVIESEGERISLRVSGEFTSEEDLRSINLRVNDRFFRLRDVATIRRTYVDPPESLFRFNGEPAIGLAIGMKPKANLLEFGEALHEEMDRIEADLPIGVGIHLVSDQPMIVEEAVGGFTKALFEAVAIVLIVSFVSLGFRAGLVVSLTIPLVLAITFVAMELFEISLQRISLGALIIALGLLVDDAMIAVEMMVARLEAGDPLEKAATYVYTSTAFPMLTGTLVTVASFIPVGLNGSAAGEFTYTLFVVIAVSLLTSWVVAVLFAPLIGVTLLPKKMKHTHETKGWFAKGFGRLLLVSMRWKWTTIAITLAMFAASIYGMNFVQQQFFPSSDRAELIVDWTLRQNASIEQTRQEMDRFEELLAGDEDVEHWSSYVGRGAVRFMLSFDVQPPSPNFGQIVIVTKSIEARERLRTKLEDVLKDDFLGTDAFVHLLDIGPPVGRPVQYRISGPGIQNVRELSLDLASKIDDNSSIQSLIFDWNEPGRVIKVDILQDEAAQLGVTSQTIAQTLNGIVGGLRFTEIRDSIYLVSAIGRATQSERASIETLQNLQIAGINGKSVPLASLAKFRYELEQPAVWRRNRLPTITIKASIASDVQPATVVKQLDDTLKAFQSKLPAGYHVAVGGAVEESAKGQGPIFAIVPVMLFAMASILMVQMQSFSRLFLVFSVAPLGLIGVVAALVPSGAPLGFVAILGVLALIGILIRNAVILIVQIETHRDEGQEAWDAVIDATEHRMRPIMLTAAAASLALIPIASEIFWGPMAFAMMGGIIVGTVLTLLFLPALYVAWFRIKEPKLNN